MPRATSTSVYAPPLPLGVQETAPTVSANPKRRDLPASASNRGNAPAAAPEVRLIIGDRLDRSTLERLGTHDWDVVVDTWSGAPRAVLDS